MSRHLRQDFEQRYLVILGPKNELDVTRGVRLQSPLSLRTQKMTDLFYLLPYL